jgi:hypothetical protein
MKTESKLITSGYVRDITANVEESRIIPIVLSTSTRDRHHTVLNQSNWQLDNYRKNPVVGYMHNLYGNLCTPPNPDDIIAVDNGIKLESVSGKLALVGYPRFEPASLNINAEKIFRKLILGTLRAASVGFTGEGSWGTGNEAEGRENETYYFKSQELLEYSIVNIPSNPDGVKRGFGFMRDQTHAALMYTFRTLGKKYRLSQIENMRICDVLTLLDGQDLEIRETNPERVRKMLSDEELRKALKMAAEKNYDLATYQVLKKYSTLENVNRINKELGLKQLPKDWKFI